MDAQTSAERKVEPSIPDGSDGRLEGSNLGNPDIDAGAVAEAVGEIHGQEAVLATDGISQVALGREPDQAAETRYAHEEPIADRRKKRAANRSRSNDTPDSTALYLTEIRRTPLLSAEEETDLAKRIEAGVKARAKAARLLAAGEPVDRETLVADAAGADAKDRFIRSNLRLVVSIAKKYSLPPGMELLDLIQEGNLGLEHAVDKFDWRKGFKFSTYATWWITQSIGKALDKKSNLIRLPSETRDGLRAALKDVGGDGGALKDPDQARLYELTRPASIDEPIGKHNDGTVSDLIPDNGVTLPENFLYGTESMKNLRELLLTLTPDQRYIVAQRIGLNDGSEHYFREIGEELGLSAEQTRLRYQKILEKLRVAAWSM